jgi:hypothetical protein
MTTASADQSAGIESVNMSITKMDEVTQQNAALVEQAAAAAMSLQEQSERLFQVVAIFELADDEPAAGNSADHEPVIRQAAVPAERRRPNRAKNVVRLAPNKSAPQAKPSAASFAAEAASDEEWQQF